MTDQAREKLQAIRTFPQLVKYLRDELDWPIEADDFEDLFFEYDADELGIDARTAAKIDKIKQLRPLVSGQPWGIFFVRFEPKRLPVVALRRILGQLVIKKRTSARQAGQAAWNLHDLLFISNYGEGDRRQITFAHFSLDEVSGDLPALKVLGWDDADTALHIDNVHQTLKERLHWPEDDSDLQGWRKQWSLAFTIRHGEVITTSKGLSIRLAQLATEIRKRVNTILSVETDKGPLRKLMTAFKVALIHDLSEDDFADMYAQTITYGLLSARVSRPAGLVADNITDMVPVTNPFLKDLLGTFLTVGGRKGKINFDEVGINDVVQTLREANMEAVLRDFGDRNPQEDPVVHFYELFLKEYDPKKRMQRGVFYTPRSVVSFIVRSVHELLQTEFGLPNGLADTTTWGEMAKKFPPLPAGEGQEEGIPGLTIPKGAKPSDPFVTILDPTTGTGTFLVEAIEVIHGTMKSRWLKEGHKETEIPKLWNRYVPNHLLPRLYGFELMMAPYAVAHMKIGLKLYETGYKFESNQRARIYLTNSLEPATDDKGQFEFAEWAPALAHEAQEVNEIKKKQRFTVVIGNPPYSVSSQNTGKWITELCKVFKSGLTSERNIQPLSDDYVKFLRLSLFILEQSYSGVHGMVTNREYIQGVIHRTLRKHLLDTASQIAICDLHGQRGELLQTAMLDENVFEIEKGVAISIFSFGEIIPCKVRYGEIVGTQAQKTKILFSSTSSQIATAPIETNPPFFFLKPWDNNFQEEYQKMPSLLEWFTQRPVTGFATHRDDFAINYSREDLEKKVGRFIDSSVADTMIRSEFGLNDTRDWHLPKARMRARQDLQLKQRIIQCTYRPFDIRWIIYSDDIIEYSRRDVMQYISSERPAFVCSRIAKDEVFAHVFISARPVEKISLSPKSSNNAHVLLPCPAKGQSSLVIFDNIDNLAVPLRRGSSLRLSQQDLLKYIYAVLHSPGYRKRYAEYLKTDFPRVPLPDNHELYHELLPFGSELVALHLMESPKLSHFITTYLGPKNSGVGRIGWSDDTVWLDATAKKKGQSAKPGTIGFRGVPEAVWNFHIGGYQVCEKWLKDRKGRILTDEDIAHYQKIVVALNETIRLMTEIDRVIDAHGGWPKAFLSKSDTKSASYETEPFEYLKAAEDRPEFGKGQNKP